METTPSKTPGPPLVGIILVMLGVRFAFRISLGRETDELESSLTRGIISRTAQ